MGKKASNQNSVILLPQSDNHTLCVSMCDVISLEDYQEFFYKPLEKIAKDGKPFGLLVNYDASYKGWSKEAAELSFQSIIDNAKNARKLAYVNPPEAKVFQIKMAKGLFGGEIQFFEANELDKALKWVKA